MIDLSRIAFPSGPFMSAEGYIQKNHRKGRLENHQEIIALRDPKIVKFNVKDLLDQRILKKVVASGYVEEIDRQYKLRP